METVQCQYQDITYMLRGRQSVQLQTSIMYIIYIVTKGKSAVPKSTADLHTCWYSNGTEVEGLQTSFCVKCNYEKSSALSGGQISWRFTCPVCKLSTLSSSLTKKKKKNCRLALKFQVDRKYTWVSKRFFFCVYIFNLFGWIIHDVLAGSCGALVLTSF